VQQKMKKDAIDVFRDESGVFMDSWSFQAVPSFSLSRKNIDL